MKKFWKLTNAVDSSESTLYLEGPISDITWWGDEVTPQAFRDELAKMKGNKLTVVINSGGGDVFAGLSIYNALRELEAEVTVRVDGLAASIASVIAMAGDTVVMSPGAMLMVHKPSVFAAGNTEDLEKAIEMLETVEESIIPIYTSKTGLSVEEVKELMEAETWMSAEKAVELGFADEAIEAKKVEAGAIQNAFGGKFAFSMSATKKSLDDFVKKVAMSEQAETPAADEPQTPSADEPEQPVKPTEPEPVADPEEPAEAPADAPVEAVATEPTNVKEENEMKPKSNAAQIAQDQVIAPANQAPVADAKPKVKDYLKSRASMEDFANVLAQNAGKEASEVQMAWAEHLKTTMGITNPDKLLPDGVITAIEDAFKEGGQIWNLVNKTGLDVFTVAWDTVTGEDSRAKGHKKGTTKGEEVITLDDRTLRPQFIYKYLTLNKEDVRQNRSTGALLRYVLSELPKRIVREVERAIVIGDGRANDSDYKINSFVSVKADAAAGNTFASRYVPAAGESRYEAVTKAKDKILAPGSVHLVAKKGYKSSMKLEKDADGRFLFPVGSNVADMLEVESVIEPDWLTDATDPDNDAYLVVFGAYNTVGDNSIEAFSNFVLKENKNEYLQEIYHGGGLAQIKAAVAIAVTPEVES